MANVVVPMHFTPRPYQEVNWARRLSGRWPFYITCWHRQAGKDTNDIQYSLYNSWSNPGTQSIYVGLDNKWVKRNIFGKYIDGRTHFQSYPEDKLNVNSTNQLVTFLNNPPGIAPAIIQYAGYKEQSSLIGSSYNKWYISELSLYSRGQFNFLWPIWDNQLAEGNRLEVYANFTPRGLSNEAADWLRALTKKDDPALWPGEHDGVFVDFLPANLSTKADGTRLYTDEKLEDIRQRYERLYGSDKLFRQEMMLEFLAVNAGLVFPTIENVRKEGRYTAMNIDTTKPIYVAWDISSKDKTSDWTAAIVFQYYNDHMIIYDYYENNRLSVVECVQELAERPYFSRIRAACLPWDSDRSGSSQSPLEECQKMFPAIQWHKLDRTYVNDSINNARRLIPNMVINSNNCEWLMECFESWEYRTIGDEGAEDFAASPKHDRYSHLMDAFRYCGDFIKQYPYITTNSGRPAPMISHYGSYDLGDDFDPVLDDWADFPPGMRPSKFSPLRSKRPDQIYRQSEGGVWLT